MHTSLTTEILGVFRAVQTYMFINVSPHPQGRLENTKFILSLQTLGTLRMHFASMYSQEAFLNNHHWLMFLWVPKDTGHLSLFLAGYLGMYY